MTDPFAPLCRILAIRAVRYVLIGVSGANFYTHPALPRFLTEDYDLFLPPDPENLVQAWAACDEAHFELWLGDVEPLDRPRDRWLAERIIERRALTRASGPNDLLVDFTLVMKGFEFETVWNERRTFAIDGVPVPTARLVHITTSPGPRRGSSNVTCWERISVTLLRIIVLELPESAAHVATDPKRVYYVGAGIQPLPAPGAPLFLTRPCLRPAGAVGVHHNMFDGLRQGLVRLYSDSIRLNYRA